MKLGLQQSDGPVGKETTQKRRFSVEIWQQLEVAPSTATSTSTSTSIASGQAPCLIDL
jgi:hypothetical protein